VLHGRRGGGDVGAYHANGTVRYAEWVSADPQGPGLEEDDRRPQGGTSISQAGLLSGRPAIGHYQESTGDLKYAEGF